MKTLKSIDWFDIALILLVGWWFFGWMFSASEPETIKLEGNAMWCFHSEYQTVKDYNHVEIGAERSFIDIIPGGGVRVFVPCEFYDK